MTSSLPDRLAAALAPRYLLERELASGGMGVVFVGRDPVLDRQVAIKVLPPERATAIAVERFLRESRLLARLTHPHIVPVLEAQHQGDLLWFVMPLVSGDTLAAQLTVTGPLPVDSVRRLGLELLDALAHSHRSGVIHRDIKPTNVFLQGPHALLADFGVAHLSEGTDPDALTAGGVAVGTPGYMAPEQRDGGVATERSDIYALGATLYEALTGRRWRASETADPAVWEGVPSAMVRTLSRAVALDPRDRWAGADEFAAALRSRGGRRRRGLLIGGVVASAALSMVVWLAWGRVRDVALPPVVGRLAVLPFSGGADSLNNGISRAVHVGLDWFPRFNLIPWEVSREQTRSGDSTATQVVSGQFERKSNGIVVLTVDIRDRRDSLLDRIRIEGVNGDAEWGAAIADSIVSRRYAADKTEFRMWARKSPNLEALGFYTRGQEAFQRDQWKEAVALFRDARRIDSTFALSTWYELLALEWQRLPYEDSLADLARHPEALPAPFDAIVRFQVEPDLGLRLRAFDSLATLYPQFAVMQQLRTNELFHRGPLVGRSLSDAVAALDSGATRFPQLRQADTYAHSVWGALRLGNEALATTDLRERKRVEPPDDRWGALLSLAVNSRFHPFRASVSRFVLRHTADSATASGLIDAVRLGLQLDDPQDQLAIGQVIARQGAEPKVRASGEVAQATAWLLLGRLTDARSAMHRAIQIDPSDSGVRMQADEWTLVLPLFDVDIAPQEREQARQRVIAMSHDQQWAVRAIWALLVDATIARDSARVAEWRGTLHARATSGDAIALRLEPLADAVIFGMQGKLPAALLASEAIKYHGSANEVERRGPFVRSAIYFLRGQWQLALKDRPEAEREWLWHENNDLHGWPQGEPQEGELDAALSAIARLSRGENLIAMGDATGGCALLRRVGELWSDADTAFAPLSGRLKEIRRSCR